MKNNRKVEVGQVRVMHNCEGELYFIKRVYNNLVVVNIIKGTDKGKSFIWNKNIVMEDIVIM